jgi:hypothetical protein
MEITTREECLEAVPGTSATVKVTFRRIAGTVGRGDARPPVSYDSEAPDAAPVDPADEEAARFRRGRDPLLALVGRSLAGTWRESGLFLGFDGLEGLRAAMAGVRPGDPEFGRAVEHIASVPSFHHLLRPHLVVGERSVPRDEPRAFQDMGFLPETVGASGFVYASGTYRLKEVAEGVARVEAEAACSLDPFPGMPPWPAASAPTRNRLRLERGTSRGWARIDTATGRLLEDEVVTELDLRWLPPGGGPEAPIPARQTRRFRLVE